MDTDTGVDTCSYLFERKPGSTGGNRKMKQNASQVSRQLDPGMYKVVRGAGLTKKERQAIESSLFEDMEANVFYSMKKHKRWQTVSDAEHVLLTAATTRSPSNMDVTIGAAEKYGGRWRKNNDNCRVFGHVEAGSDDICLVKTRSGKGVSLKSLEDSLDFKQGKRQKKGKRPANEVEKPELTIVITTPSEEREKTGNGLARTTRQRAKVSEHIWDEWEEDGVEDSDDVDEVGVDGSAERKGNMKLTDFVVQKTSSVRAKRTSDVKASNHVDHFSHPLDDSTEKLQFSTQENDRYLYRQQLTKDSTFTEILIRLGPYILDPPFFFECLRRWVEDRYALGSIQWISEDRCFVDLSRWFHRHNLAAVVGFHVLGPKLIKLVINATFPCRFHQKNVLFFETGAVGNPRTYVGLLMDQVVAMLDNGCSLKENHATELGRVMYRAAMDAPVVDSWSDYDVIRDLESSNGETTSTAGSCSSFELVGPIRCEYCSDETPQNLVRLTCGHVFCENCARFVFTEQIMSHTAPLSCPNCNQSHEIQKLLLLLPLPLIRAALRDSLHHILETDETSTCPECDKVYKKIPGVDSYRCSTCKYAFCQKCELPLHFLLSCHQMKQFVDFEKSLIPKVPLRYGYAHFPLNRTLFLECGCGFLMDKILRGTTVCSACRVEHNTQSFFPIFNFSGAEESMDPEAVALKKFGVKYLDARTELFDCALGKSQKLKMHPLLSVQEAEQVIHSMYKALRLLFFGQVWLHLDKGSKDKQRWRAVSSALNQLRTEHDLFKWHLTDHDTQFLDLRRVRLSKKTDAVVALFLTRPNQGSGLEKRQIN